MPIYKLEEPVYEYAKFIGHKEEEPLEPIKDEPASSQQ